MLQFDGVRWWWWQRRWKWMTWPPRSFHYISWIESNFNIWVYDRACLLSFYTSLRYIKSYEKCNDTNTLNVLYMYMYFFHYMSINIGIFGLVACVMHKYTEQISIHTYMHIYMVYIQMQRSSAYAIRKKKLITNSL